VSRPSLARRFAVSFALWTGIGLFFGTQTILYASYSPNRDWRPPLASAMADWYVWALLAPAILALGRRLPLTRGRLARNIPLLFLAGLAFAVIKIVLRFQLGQVLHWLPTMRIEGMILSQFHLTLATFWVILGIGAAFDYYRKFREREALLAKAQLDALRIQLQPHFLFNTLHTISAFMQEGEIESADRMITRLSDLLRLSLDSVHAQEVPLRQEIEFLQRYLDIQLIRFQDQLRVTVDVQPETLDLAVPNLILQPLVENAIKHGVSRRAGGGEVSVRAFRDNGLLRLEVHDDGPGLGRPLDAALGDGLGLANTRDRLERLYTGRHRFEVQDRPTGGLTVSIGIPERSER
jgi:two-component system, LytTR family, sensor kinase